MELEFSESDLGRVRDAVDEAEGGTSGEIVPYVVGASDGYEGAAWKGAALGALFAALAAALAHRFLDLWGGPVPYWVAVPPFLGAGLGLAAATWIPAARRALISDDVLERRVRRRAMVAFVEEEVFRTEERTGILLFVSLFEHRVVVLGDEGINRRVEAAEWQGVVEHVVGGVKERRAAEALAEAIGMCGRLLQRRGVELREDDADELSDELRTRDR